MDGVFDSRAENVAATANGEIVDRGLSFEEEIPHKPLGQRRMPNAPSLLAPFHLLAPECCSCSTSIPCRALIHSSACFSACSLDNPYRSCNLPANLSRLPAIYSMSLSVSLPHFCLTLPFSCFQLPSS